MKTVYKKHTLIKVIIGSFVVIAILLGIFYALKEKQEQGTTLTEFEITNSDLSLVTDSVVKDYVHDKLYDSVISLSFEEDNDTLFFTYTGFGSMEELSSEYIFYRHYRVIGYIERKPYNIIVLSNIHPFNRMVEETKRMLDVCAPGGGFIMDCSIVMDHYNERNFDAWYETTLKYGNY